MSCGSPFTAPCRKFLVESGFVSSPPSASATTSTPSSTPQGPAAPDGVQSLSTEDVDAVIDKATAQESDGHLLPPSLLPVHVDEQAFVGVVLEAGKRRCGGLRMSPLSPMYPISHIPYPISHIPSYPIYHIPARSPCVGVIVWSVDMSPRWSGCSAAVPCQ
jgi:hypothetical protein